MLYACTTIGQDQLTAVQNLEREKSTHVYSKRSEFSKEFAALQEMETKMNQQLKAESLYYNLDARMLHTMF